MVITALQQGIILPYGYSIADGSVHLPAVHADSKLWAVAYRLSLPMKQEFPDGGLTIHADQHYADDLDVWLWIKNGIAVGFLSSQPTNEYSLITDYDEGIYNIRMPITGGHGITAVWIAQKHRRKGFASRLANEAAQYFGITPADFVYAWPVSDTGRQLAACLSGGPIRVY